MLCFSDRSYIFPEALAVVIEVEYPAGSRVKAVARGPVVKLFHSFFDVLLHNGIFRLKIKGTVLENYV